MNNGEIILAIIVAASTALNFWMVASIKLAIMTERDKQKEWVRDNFVDKDSFSRSRSNDTWRRES